MNKNTFGDFDQKFTDPLNSKIVILPVPYDAASTWIKGSKQGPLAILEASYYLEFYDIETKSEVYKKGIYTCDPITENSSPEKMIHKVYEQTNYWLNQNKFIVTIGGDHSVSIGTIKAHSDRYGNLTVLQLDAHADLRQEYLGSKYNHACVMARVGEYCPFVQVGVRSIDSMEKAFISENRIFYAEDIYNNETWINDVISQLGSRVYITIDLDVFDPSIMPSTGTPEPGGLDWYLVLKLLKKVYMKKTIIGFDVVELCPNEINKSPDFLAAKLIYKLLSYKFEL